jgi:hypothetical protein
MTRNLSIGLLLVLVAGSLTASVCGAPPPAASYEGFEVSEPHYHQRSSTACPTPASVALPVHLASASLLTRVRGVTPAHPCLPC